MAPAGATFTMQVQSLGDTLLKVTMCVEDKIKAILQSIKDYVVKWDCCKIKTG